MRALILCLLMFWAAPSYAQFYQQAEFQKDAVTDQIYLGSPSAEKKMVVYLAPSCGGCKIFVRNILPWIERNYVDTGKGQITVMLFATGPKEKLTVDQFCIAPKHYRKFLSFIFQNYDTYASKDDWQSGGEDNFRRDAIQHLSMTSGEYNQYANCLASQGWRKGWAYMSKYSADHDPKDKKLKPPIFFVNGVRYDWSTYPDIMF